MDSDNMEIDVMKYLNIVWTWLWLIVLGTLLSGATAALVSFILPPVYEAEANIASVKSVSQLSLSPDFKTLSEAQLTQGLDVGARQKALVAIARGSEVASAVISELGPTLSPDEREVAGLIAQVTVST
ncbi:MAG: hypothetical protein HY279_04625, partial [Nitrospinae bacterium]|nr:hypothetical protein [Nitrospinota bacterium]